MVSTDSGHVAVARRRAMASLETVALSVALSTVFALRKTRPDGVSDRGRDEDRTGSGGQNGSGGRKASVSSHVAGQPGRGREADTPADIPTAGWWDIAKRVFASIGDDRILAVAAGVTFYGLLALFPAVAAFVSLYGLVADPGVIADQLASLGGVMPSGAIELIGEQVKRLTGNDQQALGFALAGSLLASLWSSNAGMKAVFDALNVAYGETERRNFIWLNVASLAFTAGTILFLVGALSGVVIVPIVLRFVGLGEAGAWILTIARWPVMLIVLMLGLAVLYRFGPSRENPRWTWITPGAILAGLGWIGFSMLFSWYVSRFGSYNATYGSLGAAIGFMTWMWLSTTIVLVGAELNAETEHQTARSTTAQDDKAGNGAGRKPSA